MPKLNSFSFNLKEGLNSCWSPVCCWDCWKALFPASSLGFLLWEQLWGAGPAWTVGCPLVCSREVIGRVPIMLLLFTLHSSFSSSFVLFPMSPCTFSSLVSSWGFLCDLFPIFFPLCKCVFLFLRYPSPCSRLPVLEIIMSSNIQSSCSLLWCWVACGAVKCMTCCCCYPVVFLMSLWMDLRRVLGDMWGFLHSSKKEILPIKRQLDKFTASQTHISVKHVWASWML